MHLLNPKAQLVSLDTLEPHATIPIDPVLLDRYTGRYQFPDRIFEIMRKDGRLFAQVTAAGGKPIAGPIFELFADGEDLFFVKVTGSHISFETGPDGRATGLIMHRPGREPSAALRLS